MGDNVLVFNCGSSSLKYRLVRMPEERELAGGEAQRVGPKTAEPARILHRVGDECRTHRVEMPDHAAAFAEIMELLRRNESEDLTPTIIGHRVVHGGPLFGAATMVTPQVITRLESIARLAPIHNPPATSLVRACAELYPELPQVLVFDTAYHATIPDYAAVYALPEWMRKESGYRKYGFHGTSHRFVAGEAARILGRPLSELNAVSCHLGSGGASLCAIVSGRSVDNTMGYSPLQGLLMSTRSGDLDPAVVMRLLARERMDAAAVEKLLNKKSGVLGMSGSSADIRDLLSPPSGQGDARASLTRDLYLWRLKKYVGSYLTVVGEPHALIFTDTIGETVPEVRAAICARMEGFGIRLSEARNANALDLPCDIAAEESRVRVLVIRTNEELAIAREAHGLLRPALSGGTR